MLSTLVPNLVVHFSLKPIDFVLHCNDVNSSQLICTLLNLTSIFEQFYGKCV